MSPHIRRLPASFRIYLLFSLSHNFWAMSYPTPGCLQYPNQVLFVTIPTPFCHPFCLKIILKIRIVSSTLCDRPAPHVTFTTLLELLDFSGLHMYSESYY
ncbi:hypothetical protein J3R30DRAFT_3679584 [Lentinula aciculospora]|uniref:Secreted protein n=1 Tax=Lentinula aciculospora TaxID=153920 RepID=A0A9W9DWY8_9AGAR|nr:hypothetical protein J3R30DRAFT_3679584 [Lentinula aciculospora]